MRKFIGELGKKIFNFCFLGLKQFGARNQDKLEFGLKEFSKDV